MSFQRLLFHAPISGTLTDILQASIFSSGAHIVRLIRLPARYSNWLLETTKWIRCVEVHITAISTFALISAVRSLRLSLLLLLQQPHRYRARLLLAVQGTWANVTEASTCEMTLLWTGYELRAWAKLLVCDPEAASRAKRLAVLHG